MGTDGGQGGRCMSCTCPGWRPGAASSVEYAPVAIAMTPDACGPGQRSDMTPGLTRDNVLTSRIIICIPFAVSLHTLPYLKDDDTPSECHRKPATATGESPDFLSKFELCDLFSESLVPEDDLIRRVSRVSTAADQE
jgi:hypothetical protein